MILTNYYQISKQHIILWSLFFIFVLDVLDVLKHLNTTKASGPDLISPRLLREGADILANPYSIFNRSLVQGYPPPPPHLHGKKQISPPYIRKTINLFPAIIGLYPYSVPLAKHWNVVYTSTFTIMSSRTRS